MHFLATMESEPSKSTTSFYRYIHFPDSKTPSFGSFSQTNMPAFKNIAVVGVSALPMLSIQHAN
jgi:hypothetical protein